MKTPNILKKEKRQYVKVKEYPNFVLYIDWITGIRECFSFHELGLIKPIEDKRIRRNLKPERVKK